MTDLGTVTEYLQHGLDGEEGGEQQVAVAEDVDVEERGIVVLEHEGEGVEDDEQQHEVLEGGRGAQPPGVVPGTRRLVRHIQLQGPSLKTNILVRYLPFKPFNV